MVAKQVFAMAHLFPAHAKSVGIGMPQSDSVALEQLFRIHQMQALLVGEWFHAVSGQTEISKIMTETGSKVSIFSGIANGPPVSPETVTPQWPGKPNRPIKKPRHHWRGWVWPVRLGVITSSRPCRPFRPCRRRQALRGLRPSEPQPPCTRWSASSWPRRRRFARRCG